MTNTTPRQEVLPRIWVFYPIYKHHLMASFEDLRGREIPGYGEWKEVHTVAEHEQKLSELRGMLEKARDSFNELLEEIDGQYELGGPSFEERDAATKALELIDQALEIAR